MFRKKNDCEHCVKLIEAKGHEKQALAQQDKFFSQECERKQKIIAWLIAENYALHQMLEQRGRCNQKGDDANNQCGNAHSA